MIRIEDYDGHKSTRHKGLIQQIVQGTVSQKKTARAPQIPPTNLPQGGKQSFHYKEEASQVQASNTSLESNIQYPNFANDSSDRSSNPASSLQQLVFYVKDTGSGIPTNQLHSIFERFQQVEENQKGKTKGTGLGLPICKEIVEFHGGQIWVESVHQPDQESESGSTFWFSLPVEQS